ncbi:GntR family transcriptional regulator [soil metagenome]
MEQPTKRVLRYERVYDLVVSIIAQQGLQPGDRLPSTAELAELAEVSVISVRRALDDLAHAGRIVRQQGVGTFVAPPRIVSEPSRLGALLDTMQGGDPRVALTTRVLEVLVGVPGPSHVEALSIEKGEPVWEIQRLRSLGGVPKILEKAVLPLSRVPVIDEDHIADGGSLYGFLRDRYGLVDDFVEQYLEVDHPDVWERENLGVQGSEMVVRIRGVSSTREGVPFDSYQQTYLAKDFVFYTSGSANPRVLSHSYGGSWAITPLGAARSTG